MTNDYHPSIVERKWQQKWTEAGVYDFDIKKTTDPFYLLVMFPYPSGARLHVGHWFQYSTPDSYGRFLRMQGKDVFHPMGFDAFGLPAENYAIKTGVHPDISTSENVRNMITQFSKMGVMYDWSYALDTSKSEYYRWTQWLFLQMYSHGLAYKKMANVNWCPKDQTVLANEQAQDGKCERCGTPISQKPLEQWFWKITEYSQRLLDGMDSLDWPEKTKAMQRNWIGKKTGIEITYRVDGSDETIVCFTTRPDTNFGATFIVLAPEHPFAKKIQAGEISTPQQKEVSEYIVLASSKTGLERMAEGRKKTGVFTGLYAINNLNGYKMPIWISDFVLAEFGTGAVVGVPGHDIRDFEFAQEFDLPIIRVVVGLDGDKSDITRAEQVQEDAGTMIHSDFLDGLDIHKATQIVMNHLEQKGWGKRVTSFRLRDWLVSRQRYWGAPIPIVYDPQGTAHPVPEEHLPWLLPTDVEFKPTGESPLKNSKEFIERTEKIFGSGWRPEFDTMDTFVCSSFYYLRFIMPQKSGKGKVESVKKSDIASSVYQSFVDDSLEKRWMPVDLYIGGPEHACMHLIYARFVMMVLNDFGIVSHEEPFLKLVHQGLITNQGAKMSKSKGNVVSPDEFVTRYGADVFRMFLMFMGPFTQGGDWSDTGIKGIDRFVQRMYRFFQKAVSAQRYTNDDPPNVTSALHAAIKKVTEDIGRMQFNTAIAALMELLKLLEKHDGLSQGSLQIIAKLLSPLAPHLAEELWVMVGGKDFVVRQGWPTYDEAMLQTQTIKIIVQVNGKLRGDILVSPDLPKEEIIAQAKAQPNVAKFLGNSAPKKEIYVKGRLVNLVL